VEGFLRKARGDRVVILIVGYSNSADILLCLKGLLALSAAMSFDVFVCENGGKDSFDLLRSALIEPSGPCTETSDKGIIGERPTPSTRLPDIDYLCLRRPGSAVWLARASHNLGYAGAVNAMVCQLETLPDWQGVWVLNPDTVPDPLALTALVDYANANKKGMVGSTVVDFDEPRKVICRGGLRWNEPTGGGILIGFGDEIGDAFDIARIEAQLDAPSGASVYVTRSCLKSVGPMDERYFLYYEDLDWGIRAKLCGLGYASNSIVRHKGGTTIGKSSAKGSRRTWLAVYLEFRNRIHFVRKHFPKRIILTHFLSMARALRYILAGSPHDFKTAIEGWYAGINGEIGPPRKLEAGGQVELRPGMARRPFWRIRIAISAFYYAANLAIDRLRRLLGMPGRRWLTILNYHEIQTDFLFEFQRQMNTISRYAQVVPPDFEGPLPAQGANVAITFDDAFISVLENAVPELDAHSFPCAVFAPVGLLGTFPNWRVRDVATTYREDIMTREQLLRLPASLVSIGSHSMTHKPLAELDSPAMRDEITESRVLLQGLIGRNVETIAFPYGSFNDQVVDLCRHSGYKFAYSIIPENIDTTTSAKTVRGRVTATPWDGTFEFFLKINGGYGWESVLSNVRRKFRQNRHA
jgi:N-acetylglucosaminyl-diphospho-decaprenol L-rhamnosyltransferase